MGSGEKSAAHHDSPVFSSSLGTADSWPAGSADGLIWHSLMANFVHKNPTCFSRWSVRDSVDPKQYIKKMRSRDLELNSNWGTICIPVEMIAADGKKRKIQAAATEGILRLVQSIPSPKAESFKAWLACVGAEHIEETIG